MTAQELEDDKNVSRNSSSDMQIESETENKMEKEKSAEDENTETAANQEENGTKPRQIVNEEDITCGLPFWKPNWLQNLASKKSYVLVYGLLGMSQSAIGSYFIGTISTIEKRFKLPSTTTGIISSSWDIGAMTFALVMAYFGSAGHKTRWVASGAVLAAISCLCRFIPHYMYGPGVDFPSIINGTTLNSTGNLCNDVNLMPENCSLNSEGMAAFIILTLANILLGVGTSSYHTLGAAYMDDNALKNKFPVLLALTTSLRYFGPTLGFLTASYTLSKFVDPSATPSFGQNDPRWVGAWYMGWIPFGTLHIFLALLMALFPKMLPREAGRRVESGVPLKQARKNKSIKDFKITLMRLLRNPVLMFNTISANFYIFGVIGYYIFMPKYIETQFRQTASAASLITGTVGLVCTAIGVMTSGAVVSRFRPRPTYLAAWNVFTETMDVIGHASFAFIGCFKEDLSGSYFPDGSWNLLESCNSNCSCPARLSYSPVCSLDQTTTFYSPCHAGCTTPGIFNGTKSYFNCSCVDGGIVTDGPCPVECNNQFILFLALLCFMKFLSATGRTGNAIIQFRAVAPEDKSISIAMAEVFVCAFAFIPAPVVYGIILDASCLVWGQTCGEKGNCWLYHGQTLRYLLNFTASGFLTMAVIMDIGVLCKVGGMKIYDEDMSTAEKKENENPNEQPLLQKEEK